MPTLYGHTTSLNVRKAMWAVQELGLDIARVDAGGTWRLHAMDSHT